MITHATRVTVAHRESACFAEPRDSPDGGGCFLGPDSTHEEDDVLRLFFHPDASPVVILAACARVTEARIGIGHHESQLVALLSPPR